ncbi:calcium-dependent phosphotriesterase [Schizophyllum commune Tattone D]|nr:calcium-dependent phosphotriesterase [Schizophyllum commune Tattone D]
MEGRDSHRSKAPKPRAEAEPKSAVLPINLVTIAVIALCAALYARYISTRTIELPPQAVVLFDKTFAHMLGKGARITEVARNDSFAFAHEAPIWDPKTEDVYFASNAGGALGMSGLHANNRVGKISLKGLGREVLNGTAINLPVTYTVQMTNGGTGPYYGKLLFINSGRGHRPSSLTLTDPAPPYNTFVLLDNFYGRQFNSLNDVKIHPSGKIFFTDTIYLQDFRPDPTLPSQVYRLDPATGAVRAVADGFHKCNGLAFSRDGKTAYVTDTGPANGFRETVHSAPSAIYAFDVDPKTHAFTNRRLFAFVDAAIPDGIQVDKVGNVYSACGDGVHVWDWRGNLIGKFFLGELSANMVFAGHGRLVILAETKIYVADFAAMSFPVHYPA